MSTIEGTDRADGTSRHASISVRRELPKAPTGISGLDEVTGGGLPRGRPTLVCGPAGCGKTLLAMEFLVRGITEFDEPGVFVAFEESVDDLSPTSRRWASTSPSSKPTAGWSSTTSSCRRDEMDETGEWDLDGLFLRLGAAIDAGRRQAGRDRHDRGALRRVRQHRDPAQRAAPAVRVAQGSGRDRGDHRRTRRRHAHPLRHRGVRVRLRDRARPSGHRADLDPAAADPQVPRLAARHQRVPVPHRRVRRVGAPDHLARACATACRPSGCPPASRRLDAMLGDGGFYRGSTVLVSGTAGTGKSTLAAQFCDATCRAWRAGDVLRLRGVPGRDRPQHGLGGHRPASSGWTPACCEFRCSRPSLLGLEAHLFAMQKLVGEFDPTVVVMDPISDLLRIGHRRRRVGDAHPAGRLPQVRAASPRCSPA